MGEIQQKARSPAARWLILAASAGAAVAFSAAIGILPTYRLAGRPGLVAMGVAAGIVWAVGAAGAVPVALARPAQPRAVVAAMQLGMALRFVLVLAISLAVALGTSLPRVPLLIWVAVHYVVALAVLTGMELWLLRGRHAETSQ